MQNTVNLLNVKFFLKCIFGKKKSEVIEITVCNDASHKSLQQIVVSCGSGCG